MLKAESETPLSRSEADDAIGIFRSENEPEGAPQDWALPPTGYRPVAEAIRPTTERGTGVLIGAAVALLVALLGVVLTLNRQHPAPRPPLDLTSSPGREVAGADRTSDAATAAAPSGTPSRAATAVTPPVAATQKAPKRPDLKPQKGASPAESTVAATAVGASTASDRAGTPGPEKLPAPPAPVTSEPFTPSATNAAVIPVVPVLSAPLRPALDDIATAAEPPAAIPTAVGGDPLTRDQAAIRRTLDVYRESYSALDASAVSMIWVGLDTKALQRAFSTLSRQDLEFSHCDLDIAAGRNRAKASCTGVLNYVRRIGSSDEHQRQMSWAIDLVRTSDRWLIENVTAR